MPIYQYHCKTCNGNFEEIVKMKDRKEPVECPAPECDNKECTKMLSVFGKHISWSQWRALG